MKRVNVNLGLSVKQKAQAVLMYALLVVVITAVGIATGVYIKRALQGRYKQTADIFGGGLQYERGNTHVKINGETVDE